MQAYPAQYYQQPQHIQQQEDEVKPEIEMVDTQACNPQLQQLHILTPEQQQLVGPLQFIAGGRRRPHRRFEACDIY